MYAYNVPMYIPRRLSYAVYLIDKLIERNRIIEVSFTVGDSDVVADPLSFAASRSPERHRRIINYRE